jgi:hypothetical protein
MRQYGCLRGLRVGGLDRAGILYASRDPRCVEPSLPLRQWLPQSTIALEKDGTVA